MNEEKEEYPTKPNYERYKKSYSQKVVFHEGKFQVRKVTVIKGYDSLMRRFDKVKETVEYLPLSVLNPPPKKVIETSIIVYRTATDFQTLKTLKAYFKKTMRISVKDKDSNIYLVLVDGKVFMTDLMKVTAPLQLNSVAKNVKLEFLGTEERISEEEKDRLVKEQKIPVFEEREMPNNETQYVLIV
jgi:hypothetical protein